LKGTGPYFRIDKRGAAIPFSGNSYDIHAAATSAFNGCLLPTSVIINGCLLDTHKLAAQFPSF
jgi:hypothetical protein